MGSYNRIPLYGAFVPVGMATTMLGPLVPSLQARWHLTDAQAGLLFTAQFLATVAASAAVGPLARRTGYGALITAGLVLVALGVAACGLGAWPLVLGAVAAYGCGLGIVIPAANMRVAASSAGSSSRPVMVLNLCWSAGAVVAPACVAALGHWFLWILASSILAGALILAAVNREGFVPAEIMRKATRRNLTGITAFASGMLFLYVGTETSLSGWVSSYAMRNAAEKGLWAVLPSVFWGSLLTGRLTAPFALGRLRTRQYTIASLGIAFAGVVVLLMSRSSEGMVAASAISGYGMAPIFPAVVAQYADRAGSGGAAGLVFSAGSLGGAAIPPLVGYVSTSQGSLRLGISMLLVLLGAMLWLQARAEA
jgi:FHS family glucose/mannose:H+ symporter-like MFS transporter